AEAVVEAADAGGGGAEGGAQMGEVEVADRDHGRGGLQLAPEIVGPHRIVEDVLGVGGEAEGHLRQAGGQPSDAGGHGREVRVQVFDASAAYLQREQQCLVDVSGGR